MNKVWELIGLIYIMTGLFMFVVTCPTWAVGLIAMLLGYGMIANADFLADPTTGDAEKRDEP
jgi:hypothetical protein